MAVNIEHAMINGFNQQIHDEYNLYHSGMQVEQNGFLNSLKSRENLDKIQETRDSRFEIAINKYVTIPSINAFIMNLNS